MKGTAQNAYTQTRSSVPSDEVNVTMPLLGETQGGQHRTNDNAGDGGVGYHSIGNVTDTGLIRESSYIWHRSYMGTAIVASRRVLCKMEKEGIRSDQRERGGLRRNSSQQTGQVNPLRPSETRPSPVG